MTDLANPTLSRFQKQKIMEGLNRVISDTPANREFKEKVFRSLIGDYTEEEIKLIQREEQEYLEQIEREMENKECIYATKGKVILGDVKATLPSVKEISTQYIHDNHET